jgi:hypothetical protein
MALKRSAALIGLAYAAALSMAASAQTAPDGPRYNGTALLRPQYREWVFLASGLGMTYQPINDAQPRPPAFTNVFANPSAYRAFLQSGTWPDKTVLVLEIRSSQSEGSINKGGRFQTTVAGLEIHVKDARFGGNGWAFFNMGAKTQAEPLTGSDVSKCVECHAANGAVDNTFVQFYPTLLDVARAKGTFTGGRNP